MTKLGCKRDANTPRKHLRRTIKSPKMIGTVSRAEIRKAVRKAPPKRANRLRVKVDSLDVLFSRYIRLRDGGNCQKCGKHLGLTQGLHCAHFFSRSNPRTRFDPENAAALCFADHQYFHGHPLEFTEWFKARLGAERFDFLVGRANANHFKIDREAIKIYLEQAIKTLDNPTRMV